MIYFLVTPVCVEWIPEKENGDILAYSGKLGTVQLWNVRSNTISQVEYTNNFDHEITLFRWHHTDASKFMFGHTDGSLSLFISGKHFIHIVTLKSI